MEQIGFVRRVHGYDMELEVRRASACGGGCSSCGGSCEVEAHIITIPNELDAKVGDFVELKGEAKNILKYTFIVYMIPFITFIVGIVLVNSIFKGRGYANYELLSFLMGIVSLAIAFLFVKIIDSRIAKKNESVISAIRIL